MRLGAIPRLALQILPWAAIIALWYLVRLSGLVRASLVPMPHEVLARWITLVTESGCLIDR